MGDYSKKISERFSNRGLSNEGYCAICREFRVLTRDHVPPKGCGNVRDAVIKGLFPPKGGEKGGFKISQGGAHFRTVCKECNSGRLGTDYDPALIRLIGDVNKYMSLLFRKRLTLPRHHRFRFQPQRVARSLLGHLLAANAVPELETNHTGGPLDKALRAYVMDPTAKLPHDVKIFYWFYPFRRQVIMKHTAMTEFGTGEILYGHILKFLPMGFWVVSGLTEQGAWKINMPTLLDDENLALDDERYLWLNFDSVRPASFPEQPDGNRIWLMSDQFVSQASPRS